ncbi:hypothetical protein BDZ94DRAFT_1252363 [Collybia nuda]|uniref:Uncharacterized protein n=1 Tax=Collybia nuda TaxID=64659 RepID=A0A9P5YE72_9AGAR|nr:hypothetical protein BDZ94DRAFT_1252363 [Collybia nuda]
MLTAGVETSSLPDNQAKLQQAMEDITYYDHTAFGKVSYTIQDILGDCREDSTVAGVVAQLSALGLSNFSLLKASRRRRQRVGSAWRENSKV